MFPTDVVIIAGARILMSRCPGVNKDLTVIDLGATAGRETICCSGGGPVEVNHVVFGNVMQTSADALHVARHVGLKTGLRIETPAARRLQARRRSNAPTRKLDEIDLVEVNEAFAAQYLAVEKALGLKREKTNVNGGAIALENALGAAGTRLVLTLPYKLRRRSARLGLATACIGSGQGIAMIVESLS